MSEPGEAPEVAVGVIEAGEPRAVMAEERAGPILIEGMEPYTSDDDLTDSATVGGGAGLPPAPEAGRLTAPPALTEMYEEEVPAFRLTLDGAMSQWVYQPVSARPSDADWGDVTTEEVYDVDALYLYRLTAEVGVGPLDVDLTWATNQGLGFGAGPALLLDALIALPGVEWLQGWSLEVRHLDFRNGHVELRSRADDEVLQRGRFQVDMTSFELRRALNENIALYGRYMSYALPRNVYLQENLNDAGAVRYYQVSDQLVRVDTDLYWFGARFDLRSLEEAGVGEDLFSFGGQAGLGLGPYTLTTLNAHERLDSGALMGFEVGLRVGWWRRLSKRVSVGLEEAFTIFAIDPIGLPDDLERDLEDEGLDTDPFKLTFGAVELLNHLQLQLRVTL